MFSVVDADPASTKFIITYVPNRKTKIINPAIFNSRIANPAGRIIPCAGGVDSYRTPTESRKGGISVEKNIHTHSKWLLQFNKDIYCMPFNRTTHPPGKSFVAFFYSAPLPSLLRREELVPIGVAVSGKAALYQFWVQCFAQDGLIFR